jgi:hypothetical protein
MLKEGSVIHMNIIEDGLQAQKLVHHQIQILNNLSLVLIRLLHQKKQSLHHEVHTIQNRLRANKIELLIHRIVKHMKGYTQHNQLEISHFSIKTTSRLSHVLGKSISPWDGSCFKEKLLTSVLYKLRLKLCFTAIRTHSQFHLYCHQLLSTLQTQRRKKLQYICFLQLCSHWKGSKSIEFISNQRVDVYIQKKIQSYFILFHTRLTINKQIQSTQQHAHRFYNQQCYRKYLTKLKILVQKRKNIDTTSILNTTTSTSSNHSFTSEDSLDVPIRRKVDFADDVTDTSSIHKYPSKYTTYTLHELCILLKSKRYSSMSLSSIPKFKNTMEMNVSIIDILEHVLCIYRHILMN